MTTTLLDHARTLLTNSENRYAELLADAETRMNALGSDATASAFDALSAEIRPELDSAEAQVRSAKTRVESTTKISEARASMSHLIPGGDRITVSERPTYDMFNPQGPSFFRDMYAAAHGSREATERLERNNGEAIAHAEKRGHPLRDSEGRALNSTSTSGGDFLQPIWDDKDSVRVPRAKRVTSLLVRQEPLVSYGNVIDIPKYTGATDVAAIQTADNAAVQNSDSATSLLTATVFTVAGYADLSRQALERAQGLDAMIYADLSGDIDKKLNQAVLVGTGSNGQPTGILVQSGTATVAFTTGSPTVALFWPKLWDAVQRVQTAVFEQPSAIIVHPRRFAWMCAAVDGQSRPLVLPTANGSQAVNAMGVTNTPSNSQFGGDTVTPAGYIGNYPVYTDASIGTTSGVGTNEDKAIVGALNESILFSDPNGIRSFHFDSILSSTAGVRLQAICYAAFSAARLPASISIVSGTGMQPPLF